MKKFKEIRPIQNRGIFDRSKIIRTSFIKMTKHDRPKGEKNTHYLRIYIGTLLAGKLKIKSTGDRVVVYFYDKSSRVLFVKRVSDKSKGYGISRREYIQGNKTDTFTVHLCWKVDNPKKADLGIRTVNYLFKDGGVVLFLNEYVYEKYAIDFKEKK